MTTTVNANERRLLLDRLDGVREQLSEALEEVMRSLRVVMYIIAEMERKTSTGDLDEKGGITLAHVKEWIQSTARAFMESRRWTSLCGATAKLALAKFQSIEQLAMNMKLDDDNNEQVRLQLSQAMEDSVRCYVTVCSVAKNLLASFAAAGLYCKWNGGGEVSSERRYAAVPLAEPRKRGVVSVKMTSHKTQPRTLDFWGPAMSDTQVACRVLSGVLRLSSIAVESELSVKAVKLQKERQRPSRKRLLSSRTSSPLAEGPFVNPGTSLPQLHTPKHLKPTTLKISAAWLSVWIVGGSPRMD